MGDDVATKGTQTIILYAIRAQTIIIIQYVMVEYFYCGCGGGHEKKHGITYIDPIDVSMLFENMIMHAIGPTLLAPPTLLYKYACGKIISTHPPIYSS